MKDVERGLSFYRDLLGFKLIEDFRYENKPVYARPRAPDDAAASLGKHHAHFVLHAEQRTQDVCVAKVAA